MKILLLGKNGQLGWELSKRLLSLGDVVALDRSQCDLSTPEVIPKVIQEIKPDIVVNAAAYTAVDKAEEEEEAANIINGHSVAVLAEQAKKHHALLIHYSTDYVFDGLKSSPYTEEDTPCPINAYGRSKLLGEQAIQKSGVQYLIFRTSWVYAARGNNFIKTMLRLASERDELKVISDQIGAPTSATLIADVTVEVIRQLTSKSQSKSISELYHLAASGETSWFGFARLLIESAILNGQHLKLSPDCVVPISTAEYTLPAKRPSNSRLDTTKLRADYRISIPKWEEQVEQTVTAVLTSGEGLH